MYIAANNQLIDGDMAKTPSNRLFVLVKSLSSSEKRYFRVYAQEDKDSKYMQLFDAIDKQDTFDDYALCEQVYGNAAPESRKYSELKSYLYENVLRGLQLYEEKRSVDFQIKSLLQRVRVLYRRSLFEDCYYLLEKAAKLARAYEFFEPLLEILDWDKRIAYARSDIDYLNSKIDQLAAEEEACLRRIANYKAYQQLFLHVLVQVRKSGLPTELQNALETNPLLQSPEAAHSYRARVLYYRVRSIVSYSLQQNELFYEMSLQLIQLMEEKPDMLREDVSEYISALSNFAVGCGRLGRYEEVRSCLDKLYRVKPATLDDELKIHRQYYAIYFRLCIESGAFEEGLQLLTQHLREVERLNKDLFERSSFYFQYFYIYFGTGRYEQALEYLNHWLNLPKTVERQELQSLARILNLVIHYEMDNTLLLDSLLRSTYRFLNKRRKLLKFEKRLIYYLRQITREYGRRGHKVIFGSLREELVDLAKLKSERAMLQLFDFDAWLRSKVEQRPFADIVKEKFEGVFD